MCSTEITIILCLNGDFVWELGMFMSYQLTCNVIILCKHIGLGFIRHVFYYLGENK